MSKFIKKELEISSDKSDEQVSDEEVSEEKQIKVNHAC